MSTAKKLRAAQKARDKQVIALRAALFADDGSDKDVTAGIAPAFMKYDRQGCDFVIKFSAKLSDEEYAWAFDLVKGNMESLYDASGYGWDDDDKKRELTEQGTRFLIVRERESGALAGFCHFRFSVQGDVMDVMAGDPCVYCWDVQIEDEHRRKGVGKHLLTLLSLIGTREKMMHLCLPVQMFDDHSRLWIESVKGFAPDISLKKLIGFDSEMEGFEVYSKTLGKPRVPAPATAAASAVANSTTSTSPPALPVPSSTSSSSSVKEAAPEDEDDEYDIVSKEEVRNINAEGEEEEEDDEELDQEEIIAGLQRMFVDKHGRAATEEEVQQWVGAISELAVE